MAPKGRKRKSSFGAVASSSGAMIPHTEAARLQRAFGAAGDLSERGLLARAQQDDIEFGQSWTPYGPLMKELDLEWKDGENMVKVIYLCPRALLYLMCEAAPQFAALLSNIIGVVVFGEAWPSKEAAESAQKGRMVIYLDEVRPGNVHRPDIARLYSGIYWSLLEFPEWFRSSQNAWIPLAYVPAKAVEQWGAGHSELMVAIFERLFSQAEGGENLALEGVRVPLRQEEPRAFLYASLIFACFHADAAALNDICSAMGAAGVKLCASCINVVGSRRYPTPASIPAGRGFVHFTDHRKSLFKLHTHETIVWVADYLAARAMGGPLEISPGAFRDLETEIGFKYRPTGLLWSRFRDVARIPDTLYWDPMHILYASGGVAQRHLNQFVHRVKGLGYDLGAVSQVVKGIVSPKALGTCNLDLEKRLAKEPRGCLKAFASETIMILTGMEVVCTEVLEPRAQLRDEVQCLRYLVRLSGLLRRGDAVRKSLGPLAAAVDEHHRRFVALYAASATWKLHAIQHLIDLIAKFRVTLSCFAPEHYHRVSKRIAAFAFRNWTKTLTVRAARQQLEALTEPVATAPFALVGPKPRALTAEQTDFLSHAGVPHVERGVSGRRLKTPHGTLYLGDLAIFRDGERDIGRGFAKAFFFVNDGVGPTFYALLAIAPRGEDLPPHCHREPCGGAEGEALVDGRLLLGACPYYRKGTVIRALETDRVQIDA